MPDIVLTTLNAKYIHAAFGLRYLLANLGDLQPNAALLEFDIHQRPADIAEVLLARNPRIIGFGIYIWNVAPAREVVAILKRVRPDITIILGGPEVSFELDTQPIVELADYIITGEADLKFAEVCRLLLSGEKPAAKIIPADPPDFCRLALPYHLYSDEDVAHRIIYVEASRGCPFTCEFCLSSLDIPVRQAPLEAFLREMQRLIDRGARQFKFVDRTFNLNVSISRAILEFCLARYSPGFFFHFEMVPDRLPEALRDVIARFPTGALQFEIGIQTFNAQVGARIKRRQNEARLEENLRFLRGQAGVYVHADLIGGLPGEDIASFAAGFDRLLALGPQEIQVGLLKRLRGTPISRHDAEWQMVYNAHPPYEILQTKQIDFASMQKLRRFARYWDLIFNSGNFFESAPLIWAYPRKPVPPRNNPQRIEFPPLPVGEGRGEGEKPSDLAPASPFHSFMHWSDWLYERAGRTDSIALVRLMELLFEFLTAELKLDSQLVAATLWHDYGRGGRRDRPAFLNNYLPAATQSTARNASSNPAPLPKRQARRLANAGKS